MDRETINKIASFIFLAVLASSISFLITWGLFLYAESKQEPETDKGWYYMNPPDETE